MITFPNIDPTAFSLFGIDIQWYGIAYATGLLFGLLNAKRILKWKMDKSIVGCSAVLNEIGSHAYHLAMYISVQKAKKIYADV